MRKTSSAVCFAAEIDHVTREEIGRLCDREMLKDRKIRIIHTEHEPERGRLGDGFPMNLRKPLIQMVILRYSKKVRQKEDHL